jgi:hypothetical protein
MKNHCQIEMCIDEILYRLRVKKLEGHTMAQAQNKSQNQQNGTTRKIRPGFGLTKISNDTESTSKRAPSM